MGTGEEHRCGSSRCNHCVETILCMRQECVSEKYDEVLREEFAWLQKIDWGVYHDSEEKDNSHRDKIVRVVRLKRMFEPCMVWPSMMWVRFPCKIHFYLVICNGQKLFVEPFVPMPPIRDTTEIWFPWAIRP